MATGCQVDFYVLEDESLTLELLACRLALMAWEQGNRIIIIVENETQSEQLDTLMWAHPKGRFLPHTQKAKSGSAPVIIGTMDQLQDEEREVLINLSGQVVPQTQRFKRLLELVPPDARQRKTSRDKFRVYREQGLQPASHNINSLKSHHG